MKYVRTSGFSLDDLDLSKGQIRLSIVKLPFGSTKAFRDASTSSYEPLEPHRVAWLIPYSLDGKEDVLVSMTTPTEEQQLLTKCLAEPVSEELKRKISKCLGIACDDEKAP